MGADPLLNTRVGNVKLVRKLGAGAMGTVYQGWHEAFACEVAVKFLTSSSGNGRERFIREGRAAAKIENEHVIRVLDAGEVGGKAYLVLEFVNGRSLGEILDKQEAQDREAAPVGRPAGSLPDTGVVAHLGSQIARGLAAIHGKGIVHRDIKPDNVLVSQDGRAKIADLGLAKQLSDPEAMRLTGSGMVVGTPLYVSPEGIRDPKTISGASDVYSLGATLYHLLSGRPPFEGKTAYDVMRGHMEERLRPLRELRPDLPAHLAELVERCLAKNPERRPAPIALAEGLEGGATTANRRRLALALALAAVAMLATGAAGWWWLRPKPGASVGPATARIALQADHPKLLARIDGGAWTPVSGPLAVAPGSRRIEVRADQDGPRWAWSGDAAVVDGATLQVPVVLARPPIAPVRTTAPGSSGLVFRDGTAYGTEAQVTLQNPGVFHLGRWDGTLWTTRTVTVGETGTLGDGPVATGDHPEGPAWFAALDAGGRPCPPHHVVTWWEAERLRQKLSLPEPPGWRLQAARPEQPVQGISQIMIAPLADLVVERNLGRLPTATEAKGLSDLLECPVWAQDQGRREAVGGRPALASLVLVPR